MNQNCIWDLTFSCPTETIDRVKKLAIYARERVGDVWLINPLAQTLEVFELERDRWMLAATHGGSDRVRARPFDAIELDLASLWSGTAPGTPAT